MLFCSVNGQETDKVAVNDRGFAYGDGIFTTAKIHLGEIQLLSQHINRLVSGCSALNINFSNSNELIEQLKAIAKQFSEAVLKVMISAGSGGRGYSRIGTTEPTVVISVSSFPAHYHQWQQTGINLGISELKLGINPMLNGMKHLNRLEQVFIRQELDQRAEDDILVSNINGHIIETSSSNIFWRKENQLFTPKIENSGVSGLMREALLMQYPNTLVDDFSLSELSQAQSIFICNCVMGVVPIKMFNGKLLTIEALALDIDKM